MSAESQASSSVPLVLLLLSAVLACQNHFCIFLQQPVLLDQDEGQGLIFFFSVCLSLFLFFIFYFGHQFQLLLFYTHAHTNNARLLNLHHGQDYFSGAYQRSNLGILLFSLPLSSANQGKKLISQMLKAMQCYASLYFSLNF